MVQVWRIAVEAPNYSANDLIGMGAKLTGGRWNSIGTAMVYCSMNISLATLETMSYLRTGDLPFNRFLVCVDIPDDVWNQRETLDPLPGGWDAVPSGLVSRRVGDGWILRNSAPILIVPSVIIPDENNVLLNPFHLETTKIRATTQKRWTYDARFFA